MKRQLRNYIAAACFALCPAGFPSYLWLFFQYQSIRSNQPQPEQGFVHALNNHGSYVYINDVESTGLSLLMAMFFAGFIIFLIVVPKRYTAKGMEHDLINPTPQEYKVFWLAMICYYGVIVFAGEHIAAFLVSRGLVLSL